MSVKRGKYRNVRDWSMPDGSKVAGLKRRPDGRFYAADSPSKTFGKDPSSAVIKYRQWQTQQTGKVAHVAADPVPVFDKVGGDVVETIPTLGSIDDKGNYRQGYAIPYDAMISFLRQEIASNPIKLALAVGLPRDVFLSVGTASGDPMTLKEIETIYQERLERRKIGMQGKSDAKRYWKRFVKVSGATNVEDLSAEVWRKYNKHVHGLGKSASYIKNAFGTVRSSLNEALTMDRDVAALQRAILLANQILEAPKKPKANPQPITPENFKKWLDASDVKHKAILLTMLNAGMRQQDIADLNFKDDKGAIVVDLDKGTIVTHRKKTGSVTRCCCLWSRTIEAIKAYRDSLPDDAKDQNSLFLNDLNLPYASGRIVAHGLRKSRKVAGLTDAVKIEQIRDGSETAALNGGGVQAVHVDILMGHQSARSERDRYLKRTPELVRDACDAIEKHYFDG